ncbi:hypothetical protein [Haliscomenobacter sp.]|uniref:hypothetical protein n=1 Tax=Haliscomenobacter sp. TaxID=2717303 RepID=UPI003BA86D79
MKINWGKILDFALETGASIAQVELWLNEKIQELSKDSTVNAALLEISYTVAKMNNDDWNYLKLHLGIKANKNETANFMLKYCNYVVTVENNKVIPLLEGSLNDAFDVIQFDLRSGMDDFEIAALYGVLAAHGERNPKANSLTSAFGRLLNSGY